jgi:NAD(P)-dependent dehydrogenase (short-subunit alcohol dehydrogenase family)
MWHERRVIVTGGTAGFGFVLARHLAAAGAKVLVVGRSGEGVRLALAALETAGPGVRGVAADLARPGEGRRVVGEGLRMLGGIDDLFCCVGRSGRGRILETPEDELRGFLDANLFAAAEITQAAADDVAAAKGHVVYIGSLAGKLVVPYMGAYSVAKSALAAFADAVRLELAPRGAHVLLVSPGPIRRAGDDPAADRVADRSAADVARSGLPADAAAPGGTAALRRLDPDDLARRVLDACRRRRSELTVPESARFLAGLIEWFPEAGRRWLARFSARGQ